jgi:hypothetical protein
MEQYKTRFSIQNHWQKRVRSAHFDLRILSPFRNILWSWAFPKARFPNEGEKLLAIRTPDHRLSYMYFRGSLDNGDKVDVYDRGECRVLLQSHNLIIVYFHGKKIIGTFNFIKLVKSENAWLVTQSKKNQTL